MKLLSIILESFENGRLLVCIHTTVADTRWRLFSGKKIAFGRVHVSKLNTAMQIYAILTKWCIWRTFVAPRSKFKFLHAKSNNSMECRAFNLHVAKYCFCCCWCFLMLNIAYICIDNIAVSAVFALGVNCFPI